MKKIILGLATLGLVAIPFQAQALGVRNVGTNVSDNGTIFRIEGTTKTPYTSAGAFLSYKFNSWNTVVQANSSDIVLPATQLPTGGAKYIIPRPGTLINDHGTVYQITGSYNRAGFTSEAVFKGLGYSYKNVFPGDTSFMITESPINSASQRHAAGTLVNDSGTFYIMAGSAKLGISSMAVLDSWGYWAKEAVTANSYDKAAANFGALQARAVTEMTIFDSSLLTVTTPANTQWTNYHGTTTEGVEYDIQYPSSWFKDVQPYGSGYTTFFPQGYNVVWSVAADHTAARSKATIINDIKSDHAAYDLTEAITNLKDGPATTLEFKDDDTDYYSRFLIIEARDTVFTIEEHPSMGINYSFADFYNSFDVE